MALLVAMNLSMTEIQQEMKHIDFASFADGPSWRLGQVIKLLFKGHINNGTAIDNWLHDLCLRHKFDPTLSFKNMPEKGYKSLHVFATLANNNTLLGFGPNNNEDTNVLDAIRMSVSIPIFFKAVAIMPLNPPEQGYRRAQKNEQKHCLLAVDGGLLANYPWQQIAKQICKQQGHVDTDHFIGAKVEDHAMTMYLKENRPLPMLPIHGLKDMLLALSKIAFYGQHQCFKQRPKEKDNTAIVDTNIKATNFDISNKQLRDLVQAGKDAAINELYQAYKIYIKNSTTNKDNISA